MLSPKNKRGSRFKCVLFTFPKGIKSFLQTFLNKTPVTEDKSAYTTFMHSCAQDFQMGMLSLLCVCVYMYGILTDYKVDVANES